MRGSRLLAAWSPRASSRTLAHPGVNSYLEFSPKTQGTPGHGFRAIHSGIAIPNRASSILPRVAAGTASSTPLISSNSAPPSVLSKTFRFHSLRSLSSTPRLLENNKTPPPSLNKNKGEEANGLEEDDKVAQGFERSEKASQAAQVNLSARLAKDGLAGKRAGFREVWRLIKIAKPEAKILSVAFVFLLVSSSITMSIPFSIGKILDIATKSATEGSNEIFGLTLPVFYTALAGILTLGAAANYGRIIILRIVGERVVARLRSNLFRRTFIQDAEFFDANRVGDLISRLSSDTIIVGKSITQNLSDGLRATVSGVAGFGLMAYVSLQLSGILALLLPPIGLGAFVYGRAIRNLSRKIQKNLGTLTKIAEERLGNVKTSQSFAGEILEVNRYNKQVRKIFELGKKESLISATFFSSVSASNPFDVNESSSNSLYRPASREI